MLSKISNKEVWAAFNNKTQSKYIVQAFRSNREAFFSNIN